MDSVANNILNAIKNIDWKVVSIVEYFIFDFISKKSLNANNETKNNKYVLQLDNSFIEDIKEIKLPPELIIDYRSINFRELLEKEFGNTIVEFAQVIIDNFSAKNLINFYNNINELIINNKGKLQTINSIASYSVKRNIISVYENNQRIELPPELFHMSSSFYDLINKIEYCGFGIKTISENYQKIIGCGITEGYTEYMVEKYYGEKHVETSNYNYQLLRKITEKLEDVIGKDKMEQLYLNANLRGLVDELSIYMEEKDVLNFINYTDYIYNNLTIKEKTEYQKEELTVALKFVNEFISKLYFSSAAKKYKEGKIIHYSELESIILKGCTSFDISIYDYQYDIVPTNQEYLDYAASAFKEYGIENIDIKISDTKTK